MKKISSYCVREKIQYYRNYAIYPSLTFVIRNSRKFFSLL